VKNPDKISPDQKEFLVKLGKKLKKLRLDQKKGYEPLAKEMGVARNTYFAIEEGRIDFQFSSLFQILLYYKHKHNITLEELFKDL
jgi:DNA-binding XRE family transcriptional regulator